MSIDRRAVVENLKIIECMHRFIVCFEKKKDKITHSRLRIKMS